MRSKIINWSFDIFIRPATEYNLLIWEVTKYRQKVQPKLLLRDFCLWLGTQCMM